MHLSLSTSFVALKYIDVWVDNLNKIFSVLLLLCVLFLSSSVRYRLLCILTVFNVARSKWMLARVCISVQKTTQSQDFISEKRPGRTLWTFLVLPDMLLTEALTQLICGKVLFEDVLMNSPENCLALCTQCDLSYTRRRNTNKSRT